MTVMEGFKIPSYAGSCYHAIICALISKRNHFCNWEMLYNLTEKYMILFGGQDTWNIFKNKQDCSRDYKKRIRENAYTLTRCGKHCYGYRLHELGMVIYMFRDGVILFTDGKFIRMNDIYYVVFPNGRTLQVKRQGQSYLYSDFEKYINSKVMSISGKIFDVKYFNKHRKLFKYGSYANSKLKVAIELNDSFDQETANRFEALNLKVYKFDSLVVYGWIPSKNLSGLLNDKDIKTIRII